MLTTIRVSNSGLTLLHSGRSKLYTILAFLSAIELRSLQGNIMTFALFQNMSVVFLKANFEYLRGNFRKAMKMLGTHPQMYQDKGECLAMMHYNNLGCIHFHLRKHHLGAFYFRKAIQENENVVREMRRGNDQNRQYGGDEGMQSSR